MMPLPWGMAMELRALILLPLCFPGLQGQTSEAQRRQEGDTLYIQCPYAPWTTDREKKYWCLLKDGGCQQLLQTYHEYERNSGDGRIQMRDNTTSKTVSITMTDLKAEDSGTYFCAYYYGGYIRLKTISLNVFKGTQQLTAEESGSVSVRCHYKVADYGAVTKAWCKMEGEMCNVLVTTSSEPPAGNSTAREGVRMQDDSRQGIVTVTMEQLQPQDSGVYWCALQELSALSRMEEVTLSVSRGGFPDTERKSQDTLLGESSCSEDTFLILSVVLLVLLLLALVTATALGVRHYRLLLRTGNREAEDTRDKPEGTAQPGSTGRRGSSQDDSKGSGYINLDVQSQPSPEDPLYCNVELSQAHRNPQCVEYAVIAFNQSPRNTRE
ncbi:hypothetical protein IHE44_0008424 [Lamprotornis superbus]|uniref:Ig-like domain-containing protein n=1 Tax=Lamprotornis superbus TaxID=245042 RepID=A0A835TNW6_9PASS|nr:hypothetical protein IHE44_0008424 [Lamprotornis superbus]